VTQDSCQTQRGGAFDGFLPASYLLALANLYRFARDVVDHPDSFFPLCLVSDLPEPQTEVQKLLYEITSLYPLLLLRWESVAAIAKLSDTQQLCLMNLAEEFSTKVNVLQSFATSAYRVEIEYLKEKAYLAPRPNLPLPMVLLRKVYYHFTGKKLSKQEALEWKIPAVYEQWERFREAKRSYLFTYEGLARSESWSNSLKEWENEAEDFAYFDEFERSLLEGLKRFSQAREFCFPLDYVKILEGIIEQIESGEIPLLQFTANETYVFGRETPRAVWKA